MAKISSIAKTFDGLRELQGQSDRGCAIVGAAIVHNSLKALLISRLPVQDETVLKMFESDSNGPLWSLGVQIKLAHALGLVGREVLGDLNRIRDMRNKFAHFVHYKHGKQHPEGLVTSQLKIIKNWVDALNCPVDAKAVARKRFVSACLTLRQMMDCATAGVELAPLPLEYSCLDALNDFWA